jgi:hypothetical protein
VRLKLQAGIVSRQFNGTLGANKKNGGMTSWDACGLYCETTQLQQKPPVALPGSLSVIASVASDRVSHE